MENTPKFTPKYLLRKKNNWGALSAFGAVAICFIASLFYWDQNHPISSYLAANPELVFEKNQLWRLFTSTLTHANLEHFLSNSMMLMFLTYFVTAFFGLWAPFFAFLMGGVINALTLASYDQNITLVGASGVVYFLWGFWLILYVCIQKTLSLPQRLIRVTAIFLVLLIPTTYSPQTSYFAHYLGFVLGALSGWTYYFLSPKRPSKEEVAAELQESDSAGSAKNEDEWGDPDWEDHLIHDIEEERS